MIRRVGRLGAISRTGAVTPDIPQANLVGWFKADTGVFTDSARTIPATNGQNVAGWADQSPAGNHLIANPTPVLSIAGGSNGKASLTCSGAQFKFPARIALAAMDYFFVHKTTDVAAAHMFLSTLDAASGPTFVEIATGGFSVSSHSSADSTVSDNLVVNPTGLQNNFVIYQAQLDSAGTSISINNGASPGSHALSNYLFLADAIGEYDAQPGLNGVVGELCEIVLYNTKLSSADHAAVLTYLNTKYAIF